MSLLEGIRSGSALAGTDYTDASREREVQAPPVLPLPTTPVVSGSLEGVKAKVVSPGADKEESKASSSAEQAKLEAECKESAAIEDPRKHPSYIGIRKAREINHLVLNKHFCIRESSNHPDYIIITCRWDVPLIKRGSKIYHSFVKQNKEGLWEYYDIDGSSYITRGDDHATFSELLKERYGDYTPQDKETFKQKQ